MLNKKEFLKRAIDSNAFVSTDSEATAVNPNIWDYKLREYEEKFLVVTPLGEQFDFRSPGVDWKVTVDDAPSAAAALTETVDVPISAFSTRNVTFTPTEYGAAYQLTRKEAVRAFFSVAERMVKKLAYAMADKKDQLAIAAIRGGATNTDVYVNSKTTTTDIASTDTIDYSSILLAAREIEDNYYTAKNVVIAPKQKQNILDLSTVNKVNEFGDRMALERGLIGDLFGLKIYISNNITVETTATTSYYRILVMGESQTGEQAFGYAIKRDPIIEKEYHARGRYWDIVGHEEYNFQVLHPGALTIIYSA